MGAAFQGAANAIRQQQGAVRSPNIMPGVSPAPQAPNRYTRTRTRPVNPPGIVKRPGIAPGGPSMPAPGLPPGVRIGTPVQPPNLIGLPGGTTPVQPGVRLTPEQLAYFENVKKYKQAETGYLDYLRQSSQQLDLQYNQARQAALEQEKQRFILDRQQGLASGKYRQGQFGVYDPATSKILEFDTRTAQQENFLRDYDAQNRQAFYNARQQSFEDFAKPYLPEGFKYDSLGYGSAPPGLSQLRRNPGMLTYVPQLEGYTDNQGNFYDPEGNPMSQPDWYGKPGPGMPSPGMPGGKSGSIGQVPPGVDPMSYLGFQGPMTGGPSQQPTNPGITNPNVSIGTPVQQPGMTPIYNNRNTGPSEVLKPAIVGYRDPSGQYYNPQGQKQSMAIHGSTTPDMRNFEFPTNLGITNPNVSIGMPITGRTPQLEAMPYTEPGYQPTQATGMNPNVSIGFGKSQPGFQQSTPGQGQANQTGPMSGGFNPSLGNTALPGNF